MAIITAEGLAIPGEGPVFNGNGSVLTLKKISETDWLLFGDLAAGGSTGFGIEDILYRKDNGVTIAVKEGIEPFTGWTEFEGEDYYVVGDRGTLVSVLNHFGDDEVFIEYEGKQLSLNRVVTTFLTDMSDMFLYATSFNHDISSWDVSNVTNMSAMFQSASSFNQDISSWDVSNVTRMDYMFYNASNFNQDIGAWDVSNVTDMSFMFNQAHTFNQDLSSWCVSLIPHKPSGFDGETVAWVKPNRQPIWGTCPADDDGSETIGPIDKRRNINDTGWTYYATDLAVPGEVYEYEGEWFYVATTPTELKSLMSFWNREDLLPNGERLPAEQMIQNVPVTANRVVTTFIGDFRNLFNGATLFNQDISWWDTTGVLGSAGTVMEGMFLGATSFNQDIGGWDTSNVTNMSDMFRNAASFNQPIGAWNTSNVTEMSGMFNDATSFNQDIGGWDTGNVEYMSGMFHGAASFNQGIGGWDTSKVRSMTTMFKGATSFNQDIGEWDTGNVRLMAEMFYGATSFNQPIGAWNTSNVKEIYGMFRNATSFSAYIGEWVTSNVTNMSDMFRNAASFNQPIGAWNTSNVTNMSGMFRNATSFNGDLAEWNTSNVTNMASMFAGAESFNTDLSRWDVGNVTVWSYFAMNTPAWCPKIGRMPSNWAEDYPDDCTYVT